MMEVFLNNVLEVSRSGLVVPDTEQMRIESDGCVISWLLADRVHCRIFYKMFENEKQGTVLLWIEALNISIEPISMPKCENPVPTFKKLAAQCCET
jgi:hypothetical protein